MKISWRSRVKIGVLGLFCYLSLFGYSQYVVNSMMFKPPQPSYTDDSSVIKLTTSTGERISAKYYPNKQAQYTLLYHNVNNADMAMTYHTIQEYLQHGYAVMAYDYPGYGTSTGKPTEESVVRAASTVYRYLVDDQHISPKKIINVGYSIGSGVATEMAVRYPSAGLVLLAPLTSAFKIYTQFHILPFDHFNNDYKIARLTVPLFIVHGTKDDAIPIWHGRQLYQIAPVYKEHLWVSGAGHKGLESAAGESYWEGLAHWVSELPNATLKN